MKDLVVKQRAREEFTRRRSAFEAHVKECTYCEPMRFDAATLPSLCAAGFIMFRHYYIALKGEG